MSLFRPQAVKNRKQRMHGDILLLPHIPHTLLLACLMVWTSLALIWLSMSHYARKETVSGWLEPPAGVVRLYPDNSGVIKKILITEGALVNQDQALMIIETEAQLSTGQQLSSQLLLEYESQRNLLEEDIKRTGTIYDGRNSDLIKKIKAAQQEFNMLSEQLQTTNHRYQLVLAQSNRVQKLQHEGYVSNSAIDEAIQNELSIKNEYQSLLRNQISQKNLIEQYQNQKSQLPDEAATDISQLQARLSDIKMKMTQLNGQSSRVLKASKAGVINNLQAREGQQIYLGSTIPLLTLIPQDEHLIANLLVPVRSAGFLELDQPINIRYDAFPYQKFGLYKGKILQISKTVLLPNELLNAPVPIQEPVYRITAQLAQPVVQAYGERFPLKPGMTLSADIHLSERSLLQWLLEPLYSLNGRI